jgi:preprotein translocase subunit SecE
MKKIVQFFKESVSELKKVSWPSRDEVKSSTKVVVVSVFIFAAILGLVDFLLVTGIDKLFS